MTTWMYGLRRNYFMMKNKVVLKRNKIVMR